MTGYPDELEGCTGFQWDAGNAEKNWKRHAVSQGETEQVFFNRPVLIAPARYTTQESRYAALGQTTDGRLLTVIFTIRGELIRVISARDISESERRIYERPQEEEDE